MHAHTHVQQKGDRTFECFEGTRRGGSSGSASRGCVVICGERRRQHNVTKVVSSAHAVDQGLEREFLDEPVAKKANLGRANRQARPQLDGARPWLDGRKA